MYLSCSVLRPCKLMSVFLNTESFSYIPLSFSHAFIFSLFMSKKGTVGLISYIPGMCPLASFFYHVWLNSVIKSTVDLINYTAGICRLAAFL